MEFALHPPLLNQPPPPSKVPNSKSCFCHVQIPPGRDPKWLGALISRCSLLGLSVLRGGTNLPFAPGGVVFDIINNNITSTYGTLKVVV